MYNLHRLGMSHLPRYLQHSLSSDDKVNLKVWFIVVFTMTSEASSSNRWMNLWSGSPLFYDMRKWVLPYFFFELLCWKCLINTCCSCFHELIDSSLSLVNHLNPYFYKVANNNLYIKVSSFAYKTNLLLHSIRCLTGRLQCCHTFGRSGCLKSLLWMTFIILFDKGKLSRSSKKWSWLTSELLFLLPGWLFSKVWLQIITSSLQFVRWICG